jgi:hypothetical protein
MAVRCTRACGLTGDDKLAVPWLVDALGEMRVPYIKDTG